MLEGGLLACGELTHALRLVSELVSSDAIIKATKKYLFSVCIKDLNSNEKIQRGRLTKEDAVGYSCTNSKKSPFDQL